MLLYLQHAPFVDDHSSENRWQEYSGEKNGIRGLKNQAASPHIASVSQLFSQSQDMHLSSFNHAEKSHSPSLANVYIKRPNNFTAYNYMPVDLRSTAFTNKASVSKQQTEPTDLQVQLLKGGSRGLECSLNYQKYRNALDNGIIDTPMIQPAVPSEVWDNLHHRMMIRHYFPEHFPHCSDSMSQPSFQQALQSSPIDLRSIRPAHRSNYTDLQSLPQFIHTDAQSVQQWHMSNYANS